MKGYWRRRSESNRRIRLFGLERELALHEPLLVLLWRRGFGRCEEMNPHTCRALPDQRNSTNLVRCQVVFYFVLLLPQFGSTSVNTSDFAPKLRITHKHPIESGFRETQ